MSDNFGVHLIVHNKDVKGKATAIYTAAPSTILALAEMELLKRRAIARNPKKRIEAFIDVDTTMDEDEWMSAYKGRDRQELYELIADLREQLGEDA